MMPRDTSAAVLMINPKFPHNVAQSLRACAAFGVPTLRYTGPRVDRAVKQWGRLPREERMKGYKAVDMKHTMNPFGDFAGFTPVAVEVRENAEQLPAFEHPLRAVYVFGPEDGGLTSATLQHCHRFLAIPTLHCLNLSMAVGLILYDRMAKLNPTAMLDMGKSEGRGGYYEFDDEELRRAPA